MQSKTAADPAQVLADLQAEIARLHRIIELKDEQIRLLNLRLFGPKTEKLSSAQMTLMLQEVSLTSGEVEQEAQRPQAQKENPLPRAKQPRPNHPGRERLPQSLERREQIIPCCPEDCRCLIFRWAEGGLGRRSFSKGLSGSCSATGIAPTTNWAKGSCMWVAWHTLGEASWRRPNWQRGATPHETATPTSPSTIQGLKARPITTILSRVSRRDVTEFDHRSQTL